MALRSIVAALAIAAPFLAAPATAQMPALKPLPGTPALGAPADPDRFTFVVAGDNRPHHEKDQQGKTPRKIFAAAAKLQPALVFWTGDTIYGKAPTHPTRIAKEYKEFLALAKTAQAPVFNAPGNHEMDDGNDVPNPAMQSFYRALMGEPYGSFTYGHSRFIALNTEEVAPAAVARSPRAETADGKGLDPGYVSPAQLAALAQDLDASQGLAHVFVFMHHPIHALKPDHQLDAASAKALTDLFAKHPNVSYVLAGHEHVYFNPQDPGNITTAPGRTDPAAPPTYLVTGGAGAPLASGANGFHHYLVFAVNGNAIEVTLVKL
jgi:3',5'-cyclic AMP phosphodiesterase CpdA